MRESVGVLGEEGLMVWFTASQSVETDEVSVQIDFASNESVSPECIEREGMAEQFERTVLVGATQEDDLAAGMKREVGLPWLGEGHAWWSGIDAESGASAAGSDELGRLDLESKQGVMLKARPDLGLPAAVVALDGSLEAGLARRSEDGNDLKGEAEADDSADGVGKLMSALEASVIVKLRVGGQADALPVGSQRLEGLPSGDEGPGPGLHQATVERDGVEDLDIDSAANDKAGDDVEAIQLGFALSHWWQVPTSRRGLATNPSAPIQGASAQQDPCDCAHRRHGVVALCEQLAMDRGITELSQRAGLLESLASGEDDLFGRDGYSVGGLVRAERSIAPRDAVQPLSSGSGNPSLNSRAADPELAGDPPSAPPRPNGRDDGPTLLFDGVFLPSSFLRGSLEEILLVTETLPESNPSDNQAVEADRGMESRRVRRLPTPLGKRCPFPTAPTASTHY